jgi:hypothetical protein
MNGTDGAGVLLTARHSSTFCPMPNDCRHRRLARTKQIQVTNKNQCLPDLASDQNVISVQMNHAQVMAPSQNS